MFLYVCTIHVCYVIVSFSMFIYVMIIDIRECRCCSLLPCFSFLDGCGARAKKKEKKERKEKNDGMTGCRVFKLGRSPCSPDSGGKVYNVHRDTYPYMYIS